LVNAGRKLNRTAMKNNEHVLVTDYINNKSGYGDGGDVV
jgi:hypothetical protein